jgi:protein Mpv17
MNQFSLAHLVVTYWIFLFSSPVGAFSMPVGKSHSSALWRLRGGQQTSEDDSSEKSLPVTALASLGRTYAASLERNPIFTKSVTAGCIFALSDLMAQRLEKSEGPRKMDWTRMLASAAVGLFYFGPAAHYWYEMIFKVFPGSSLVSTLKKAAAGQLLFGPSFTCVFFAVGLLQEGKFSPGNWLGKIRKDLPGVWLAGIGFWPLVDMISYSLIAPQWIPLFVNICSLIWTTYLVLKSYS